MDIEAMMKQERRALVLDAVKAGFYLSLCLIMVYLGQEWWMIALFAMLLGRRLGTISVRSRVIEWMRHVQHQDAVVESLVTQMDASSQPKPQQNGRIDYV